MANEGVMSNEHFYGMQPEGGVYTHRQGYITQRGTGEAG